MDEFTEFLDALAQRKAHWLQKLPELTFLYSLDDDVTDSSSVIFTLHAISLPTQYRRQGLGERIMGDFTLICDRYNIRMRLEATSIMGTPLPQLVSFYRQHGFYPTSHIIDNESIKMERLPVWEDN